MTEPFLLTVNYKGREIDFTAQLVLQGYTHKFKVLVNNTELYFEPDEEGAYRAVKMPGQEDDQLVVTDRDLLSAIQQKIAAILA
ncbi:MAG: hypothetical protein ABIQ88_18430 [Chitinophagaceae bacterium]